MDGSIVKRQGGEAYMEVMELGVYGFRGYGEPLKMFELFERRVIFVLLTLQFSVGIS